MEIAVKSCMNEKKKKKKQNPSPKEILVVKHAMRHSEKKA